MKQPETVLHRPGVIIRRPVRSPERENVERETPVRIESSHAAVVDELKTRLEKRGVVEKGGAVIANRAPERLERPIIQEKVKRVGEPEKKNLSSLPRTTPVNSGPALRKPDVGVGRPVLLVRPGPQLIAAHANLNLDILRRLPMKLNKVVKGNEGKLTCMLDVGGVSYVAKVGAGYRTMQDHITNTDLFIRLAIPGVQAPITRVMTPEFRTALERQLNPLDPSDKQLLDALGTFDQISKLAPGLTVQDVFDPENAALGGLLDTIRNKSTEDAALALTGKLEEALNARPTMDKVNGLKLIPNLKNPHTRAEAIKQLKTTLNIPANKQILSVLESVSLQGVDTVVPSMTSDISKLATAKTKLTDFVKSEAGGYALGGMALTDLLVGMDDRIVGSEFNGGNFMFDPDKNEFWCVDNTKDVKFALSANNPADWKTFALRALTDYTGVLDDGQSIEERLHWAVYDRKTQETREIAQNVQLGDGEIISTQAGIQRAVTETLQKMHALVNDNTNGMPGTVRNRLKARIEFLEARRTFTGLLEFDPAFQEVPSATKPGVFKIIGRNIKGLVTRRPLTAQIAEQWKVQSRDPNTTNEELAAIDDRLSQALQDPDVTDPDQRLFKALFAARSERFRRSLIAKTAALTDLAVAGNKVWGDLSSEAIKATITDIADPWLAKFDELGDKTGKAALNTAVNDFVHQLNSQL